MPEIITFRINNMSTTSFNTNCTFSVQPSYAFFAYNSSTLSPATGNIVRFVSTLINEQNVYNTGNGHFGALVGGSYTFHSTICTTDKSVAEADSVSLEFYVVGKGTAGKFTTGDAWNNCASGSTTERLQAGSQVYLRVTDITSGSSLQSRPFMNTFSGYLIGK